MFQSWSSPILFPVFHSQWSCTSSLRFWSNSASAHWNFVFPFDRCFLETTPLNIKTHSIWAVTKTVFTSPLLAWRQTPAPARWSSAHRGVNTSMSKPSLIQHHFSNHLAQGACHKPSPLPWILVNNFSLITPDLATINPVLFPLCFAPALPCPSSVIPPQWGHTELTGVTGWELALSLCTIFWPWFWSCVLLTCPHMHTHLHPASCWRRCHPAALCHLELGCFIWG